MPTSHAIIWLRIVKSKIELSAKWPIHHKLVKDKNN